MTVENGLYRVVLSNRGGVVKRWQLLHYHDESTPPKILDVVHPPENPQSEEWPLSLLLVDPKMLELAVYDGIPHLLAPVVTDMKQAANALHWCVAEMERRYKLMSWVGVRNLSGYNHKVAEAEKAGKPLEDPATLESGSPQPLTTLPHIVVVIDELADLMMVVGKKVEELIARLAQKARAAGIHDLGRKYHIRDMVTGDLSFAATGITNGELLKGVAYFADGAVTESVVMRGLTGTSRRIIATQQRHRQDSAVIGQGAIGACEL